MSHPSEAEQLEANQKGYLQKYHLLTLQEQHLYPQLPQEVMTAKTSEDVRKIMYELVKRLQESRQQNQ